MTDPVQPPWLALAWTHFGLTETSGPASTPDIVAFYRDAGHPSVTTDAVPWCAAFVGACLKRTSFTPTGSLLARSYVDYGEALKTPRPGAIVVLSRGTDPSAGHVGFWLGETSTHVFLLGGNQSDRVCVEAFSRDRLLAMRWPTATTAAAIHSDTLFTTSLAHILVMEGGYSDDPHDPGGPTNFGITLATLAAWRNIEVSPATFADLKVAIRSLNLSTVTDIYRARYWAPSEAANLPPALALMHFDASVNHGVGGAARLLQQALNVEIDGEIGPQTLAAAATCSLPETLDAYAELRRARYRALPHFWRFGRGWLARVDATLKTARGLLSQSSSPKKETTVTTTLETPTPSAAPKWWGHSMTIWGTIISFLSTALPILGPLIGLDLSADNVRDLGAGITQVLQALGALIGTALTIYGRTRAVAPLIRRPISLRL